VGLVGVRAESQLDEVIEALTRRPRPGVEKRTISNKVAARAPGNTS
jgi:hypothetical protein